jgi:tRNA (guanine-N7-)-methyltransferase
MRVDPYAHAPRLPLGEDLDPCALFDAHPAGAEGAPLGPGPVELEIGPGRGWFTVERLAAEPSVRVLGLEIRRKWATIVDDRLRRRGLAHRGRVFAEDAKLALPRLRAQSVSVAYLHFPDPWWKKRHEKRLVLGEEVLAELARLLVPGGHFLVQTDVFERADAYQALVGGSAAFEAVPGGPRVEDHPYGARSPRERKALEDGLPVVRLHYRRRACGPD